MLPLPRRPSYCVLMRVSVIIKLLRYVHIPNNQQHRFISSYLERHCSKKLHHTYKRNIHLGKLLDQRWEVIRDLQHGLLRNYSVTGTAKDRLNSIINDDCTTKVDKTSNHGEETATPSCQPKFFSLEDSDYSRQGEGQIEMDEGYLKKIFPYPKNNLDNAYTSISSKLGSAHKVQMAYTKVSEIPIRWECTARTTWPEVRTFKALASSKGDATKAASLTVLKWLQSSNVLNKNGQVDINTTQSVKDSKIPTNILDSVIKQENQEMKPTKMDNEASINLEKNSNSATDVFHKLFPHPKNKLDNVFTMISLKSRTLYKTTYEYSEISSNPCSWQCTATVPFPREEKFTEVASSKAESTKKASLKILIWLQEQGTLTKDGELSSSVLEELEKNAIAKGGTVMNEVSQKKDTEHLTVETEVFDDKEFDELRVVFPFPRNNVGNVYGSVSSKLGNKHKAVYEYEQLSQKPPVWKTVAKVTWPSEQQFTSTASTKSEAAHRVSLYILKWLQSQGVINKDGGVILKGSKKEQEIKRSGLSHEMGMELKKMNDEFALKKKSLQAIFPFPKSNLNNAYGVISSQIGTQHKVSFGYQQVSVLPPCWQCTASVTWPAVQTFTCLASNKSEAALRASLNVLHWLQAQGKINRKGEVALMIHTNRQAVRIPPIAEITLSADSLASIEQIVNQYYKDVLKNQESTVVEEETVVADVNATVESKIETENDEFFTLNDIESLPIQRHKRLMPHVADRRDQELFRRYLKEKSRREEISAALPIDKYREEIIQLVDENRVVVIKGEPGCGKSTQVAQYLMDWHAARQAATDCNIVITQPRRISAISLADRVAFERNEMTGDVVGYQVRLDAKRPRYSDGFILFCSTGLLVRRIIGDPELSGVSHVIVDEAHERDTQVDFLLLLLKRALELNPSLKIIVMSATINAELFTEYFNKCPSISIPGFTYPVKQHFLDSEFKSTLMKEGVRFESENSERPTIKADAVVGMITWIHRNKPKGAILVFLPGWLEIRSVKEELQYHPQAEEFLVVPAHSKLSSEEQRLIFKTPNDGRRKIILSTNIAETSLTINDVVYVVDSGALKEERMDINSGLVSLDNQWASQANVQQRKGRAGRVQPGESYHLFSEEKYKSLNPFPIPEINRIPLTRSVLDVKMYTKDEDVSQFMSCLPEPPRQESVTQAVRVLQAMGALDDDENLSALGKRIYKFPLDSYLSKILVHGCLLQCANPLLSMVTLLSADYTIFENTLGMRSQIRQLKQQYSPSSDHIATSMLYKEWENHSWADPHAAHEFCMSKGLIGKNMERTKQLRALHLEHLKAAKLLDANENINDEFSSSNKFSAYSELIKGVLLSGLGKCLLATKSRRNLRGLNVRTMDGSLAIIGSESVNSKFKELPSPFLTYFKSMSSTERRAVIIHETSLLSPITVALFLPGVMTLKNMAGLEPGKSVISIEGPKTVNIVIGQKEGEQLLHLRQVIWNVLEYLVENEGEPKDMEQYKAIAAFREDLLPTLANLTSEQGVNLDYTEDGELRTEPPSFVRPQWG